MASPFSDHSLRPLRQFSLKVLILLGFGVLLWIFWEARTVLATFAVSGILALFLTPGVILLERKKISTWLAVLLVYIFIGLILTLIAFTVIPLFSESISRIATALDAGLKSLQEWLSVLQQKPETRGWMREIIKTLSAKNFVPLLREHLSSLTQSATVGAGAAIGIGWNVVSAIFSTAFSVFTVLVFSFVLLLERKRAWTVFLSLLPKSAASYIRMRSSDLSSIALRWIRGQGTVAFCVGLLVYIGLWVLEMFGYSFDRKLNLAFVAGMMTFIPYVGVPISLIPALAFALGIGGWGPIIGVAVVYAVSQFFEGNFISPWVMGKTLDVSPTLALGMMLILGGTFGIPGVVLAAPMSAIIAMLYADFISKHS